MQVVPALSAARQSAPPPELSGPASSRAPSTAQQPLRLLLVDDHPILRAGLRALLSAESDFDVVAEAESGESALLLASTLRPDLVLMDFSLPGMSGADAARHLKRDLPGVRVLAVSVHDEPAIVRRLLDSGVDGYLLKRSASIELVNAVRKVAGGVAYLDPALPKLPDAPSRRSTSMPAFKAGILSDREAEVTRLLAQGLTMKEVALQLGVSPRTLETYRARAMEKLGLKSRAEVIRYAMRRGWLDGD